MLKEKLAKNFIMGYLGYLLLATFFILPTLTSLYYYSWGKDLAWSYFDGPPMIAYFFRISHILFGNTYFSINIVGFFCVALGAFYIYKIGCLLQNRLTGLISAMIWLVLPSTTESIFLRVLYDAPLNLFTIISIYYLARYLAKNRVIDLYLSAFFIGAMILSKYTAAVTVLTMFLYVVLSKHRILAKSVHFYLGILLLLIVVSPVIYWNASHNWISITYLLNFHSQAAMGSSVIHSIVKVLLALLINYSVFLVLGILGWFKYRHEKGQNSSLEFIYFILFTSVSFWLLVGLLGGEPRRIYMAPLGINIALIAGYAISEYHYDRLFIWAYPIFLLISLGMILTNAWPLATYLTKGREYAIIETAFNQLGLFKQDPIIVTGSYTSAAELSFFMPQKTVYTLPCGESNQYQYVSRSFFNDFFKGLINKITFVDFNDAKLCANRFFNKCEVRARLSQTKTIPLIGKSTQPVNLYVYECSSPRTNIPIPAKM